MAISDVKVPITDPNSAIGKKVRKGSDRPFKSRQRLNTVKGVTTHPILNIPAFTFEEDESIVEVRQCEVVTTTDECEMCERSIPSGDGLCDDCKGQI